MPHSDSSSDLISNGGGVGGVGRGGQQQSPGGVGAGGMSNKGGGGCAPFQSSLISIEEGRELGQVTRNSLNLG